MAETSPAQVLIVDDDQQIRSSLQRGLRLSGFAAEAVDGGSAAIEHLASHHVDAIVLDVTMPDLDGVEVCRRIRAAGLDVPVCMLSARDEVDDRVAGLRAGADDYLVKPFSLEELRLRLEALLRRRPSSSPERLGIDGVEIDPPSREARYEGREIDLTRREFDLLATLFRNRGVVLSRSQLLAEVWGYDFDVQTNVVDVFVGYVRRKLDAAGAPNVIETVRGVGYVVRG
ncbi:MAG: response regulator transcription factor [Actinomycetota bacterium]